jgi:2-methylisocitrate lyase-like PEP mutase family enzyme
VNELAEMGVRRVSVGSAMARAAWTAFMRAAKGIAEEGSFAGFRDLVPLTDLNQLFLRENAADPR